MPKKPVTQPADTTGLHQTFIRVPKDLWKKVAQINLDNDEKMNPLIVRLLTEYAEKSAK